MVFEGKLDMVESFVLKVTVIGGGVVARSPAQRDVIRTLCQKFVGRLIFTHILNFRLRMVSRAPRAL